ncbi:MAG: AAA family ATPase [bacterium]|nr:AAA family ATPase [bacterium]
MKPVLIATSFFSSLEDLEPSERLRAIAFLNTFQANPASPGISLERVKHPRSSDVWSGRISRDLRAILHKDGENWALLHAGHHDPAYDWACRRNIGRHPATGVMQIVEAIETVEEVQRIIQVDLPPEEPRIFERNEDAYLVSLGLPESWLPAVHEIRTDDQLLSVCDKLPPDVAERLMDVAAGEVVTPPEPVPVEQPAAASPDTRRRFFLVEDTEDLRTVLEAPLERWIAFLHPSQRSLVEAEYRGPAKVSGAAGTGKTVVAMHRARHLARRGHRVLLTSFVTTLCQNLERNLRLFCRGEDLSRITVSTVHKQALAMVRAVEPRARPATHREVADLLNAFSRRFAADFEPEFVRSEWESVIELQGIGTWPEYRRARRSGRGRPLSVRDRRTLWQVFEAVLENLRRRTLYTFSGLCRQAELLLERGEASSPFDAVVVDEVQDLRPPELRFVHRLTAAAPGLLMVVGDAGQRIYPGGFSLSALGIEVRGRSRILRLNYRTTEQIRRSADRLLGETQDDMDGGAESRRSRSLLRGPEPTLRGYSSVGQETSQAVVTVRAWLDGGLEPEEIGVFARTARLIERIAQAFADAGLPAHRLKDEGGASQPGIHLGTMHRAKGLEFKAVLAVSCSAGVMPNPRTLSRYGDPVDRQDAETRERHLLYVVMTRARDELVVTWVGRPSPLLEEVLDHD